MRYLVLLLPLCLTACHTFSKKECAAMDWSSQGYLAAMDGKDKNSSLGYYQENCGMVHGVLPDEGGFDRGYRSGLEVLCTQSGGVELGSKGGNYRSICPKEKEKDFLAGFTTGKLDYATRRIEVLEGEIVRLRRALSDRDSRISELEMQILQLR